MKLNRVEEFRRRKGMNLSELAGMLGISRQSLHAIEIGSQVPKVYLAVKLAKVLGTDVEDLFPWERPSSELRLDLPAGKMGSYRVCVGEIGGTTVVRESRAAGFGSLLQFSDAIIKVTESGVHFVSNGSSRALFVDGCDPILGLLSSREGLSHGFSVRWFYGSNKDSLRRLDGGLTHCALTHGETAFRYEQPRANRVIVPLGRWDLALCFLEGNPKGIGSIADVVRPDVRFAWREQGSGVRSFVDGVLRHMATGSDSGKAALEFNDHYQIVAAVKLGLADCGVIPLSIAESNSMGYLPVGQHQSQLVFSEEGYQVAAAAGLFDFASSKSFRRELATLAGYELVG